MNSQYRQNESDKDNPKARRGQIKERTTNQARSNDGETNNRIWDAEITNNDATHQDSEGGVSQRITRS